MTQRGDIRHAHPADAEVVAHLLDRFNREFEDPSPGPAVLAERTRVLLADGDAVLLAERSSIAVGLAVLRFRPAIWSTGFECYLAELYVSPAHRGEGLGRALMDEVIAVARGRGADTIDLGTTAEDVEAVALYESLGFVNTEGGPDGPSMRYYELEI